MTTAKLPKINKINDDVTGELLGDYADLENFASSKLSYLDIINKNNYLRMKCEVKDLTLRL